MYLREVNKSNESKGVKSGHWTQPTMIVNCQDLTPCFSSRVTVLFLKGIVVTNLSSLRGLGIRLAH
jgi:hypothetical protein